MDNKIIDNSVIYLVFEGSPVLLNLYLIIYICVYYAPNAT